MDGPEPTIAQKDAERIPRSRLLLFLLLRKKKPPAEPKEPKLNESRSAYHKVLRGEMALLCLVGSSSDVVSLSEALADETVRGADLRLYCVLSGDSFRAAPQLLDLDATCVVRAGMMSWPNTNQTICPAVYLRNAGLDVVLMPRDDGRGGLGAYVSSAWLAAAHPDELARRARAGCVLQNTDGWVLTSWVVSLLLAVLTTSVLVGADSTRDVREFIAAVVGAAVLSAAQVPGLWIVPWLTGRALASDELGRALVRSARDPRRRVAQCRHLSLIGSPEGRALAL